jgi:hypothetical protein
MAYQRQTFVDQIEDESGNIVVAGTKLSAGHLNRIEEGIVALEKFIITAVASGGELLGVSKTYAEIYEAYLSNKSIELHIVSPTGEVTILRCSNIGVDNAFFDGISTITGAVIIHSVIVFSDDTSMYVSRAMEGGSAQPARIGEVTLLASGWVGEDSPYSQVVTIPTVTANTQVDLTPSAEQLSIFHHKDLAFVTENDNGVVTVYAIGQKPENDYTIQVTMTEVAV